MRTLLITDAEILGPDAAAGGGIAGPLLCAPAHAGQSTAINSTLEI